MCTALRELVEDARREGFEQGWREGFKQGWREGLEQAVREEKLCQYLRALALNLPPEAACAVAGISEEELHLGKRGKL